MCIRDRNNTEDIVQNTCNEEAVDLEIEANKEKLNIVRDSFEDYESATERNEAAIDTKQETAEILYANKRIINGVKLRTSIKVLEDKTIKYHIANLSSEKSNTTVIEGKLKELLLGQPRKISTIGKLLEVTVISVSYTHLTLPTICSV
eukprot:TRINITY_DN10881_c0_g1_i1.p1 TRINITY_DN10881_c0_g1~~TRINITY_DN10881_c0_g1_i1.p1  ORF type:complete len:148 (-),score=18.12 TRINITY_DN10881_c0_g1_i1:36-479(-)